jgi:tetratricopeptide (TPR) repeat protein
VGPQLERVGDNRLISGKLIHLIFYDKSNKDNPRYVRRMVSAAQASHLPRVLCHAYRAQSFYYRVVTGDYYRDLQSIFQQLRTAQQANLADEASDALQNLGDIYVNMADYEPGLRYYRQAVTYAAKVAPASYKAVIQQKVLTGLGYGYLCAGNYSQALATLQQAAQIGDATTEQTIYIKSLIARIFDKQHASRTLAYTRQLLREAHQQKASKCYPELLQTLASYYLRTGQADSAVADCQRALRFSNGELYKEDEVAVLQLLMRAYAVATTPRPTPTSTASWACTIRSATSWLLAASRPCASARI